MVSEMSKAKDERLKALRLGKSSVLTQIRCEVEQKLGNVLKTLPIPPSAYDIQQSNGTLIIKIKI
jgi:hypothetical protein